MKYVKHWFSEFFKSMEYDTEKEEFEYRKMQLTIMFLCGMFVTSAMWIFLSMGAGMGSFIAAIGQGVYPFYRFCKTFKYR